MKTASQVITLAAGVLLGSTQQVFAAQQVEEDSVYHWGRWAVLSPAAGGAEPYAEADAPGAAFNARPGDASEFQPELASIDTGPVLLPPAVVPNPPGASPPIGDGRVRTPGVTIGTPPIGDGRVR
jgi:hypothetical protein